MHGQCSVIRSYYAEVLILAAKFSHKNFENYLKWFEIEMN